MSAPIALFAFNRPEHLRRTLEALAANDLAAESDLTIFCDGPRQEQEKTLTDAVRTIARTASEQRWQFLLMNGSKNGGFTSGFRSVTVVEREKNLGCANAIISGLAEMFSQHERLVVIEDDILCSPHTLRFLNNGLEKYEKEPVVFNIAAWSPPWLMPASPYLYDAYFILRFNCWGWASWRDRWQQVDWSVPSYEVFAQSPILQQAFNQGGSDLSPMLAAQMEGKLDTWDIRMDYARFKHGGLGLNPTRSYTTNIGMGSGTHTLEQTTRYDNDLSLALTEPRLPDYIFVDADIVRSYKCEPARPRPFWQRGLDKVARMTLGRKLV